MAKKAYKPSKTEGKTKKRDILEAISPGDAFMILKKLAEEDENTAERIEQIAREYLSDVDMDDVASEVYYDLDHIDVEELWERSGSTRYGYVDPGDMAFEMFEEALEPFLEELRKYQKLSMDVEAKNYCFGILKGIYQFEKNSKSEFKDWAVDAPGEYFEMVLYEWKKGLKNQEYTKEVDRYIKKNFADLLIYS